ncbi:MAG: hypothetical protein AB7F35_23685 [Acetobacteraceae bacterium]
MRRGDDATAWAINDAVLAERDPATRDDPRQPYHLRWVWDGRPYRGRHVLVRCYNGLGDTLHFARYLPRLRSQVASLTVEAQPELVDLLARAGGQDRIIPFDLQAPAEPLDCDIGISELPHAMRLPASAVPPLSLRVDPVPSVAGAIGLCWQGSPTWDPARAIPPALVAPLARRYPMLSLQPGPTDLTVLDPGSCPPRIEDTAAIIAGLDLVITVDTMIAHLAGSLGRPTWLLLKDEPDWRWGEGSGISSLYPTIRMYRQSAPGDWQGVIARVEADLRRLRGGEGARPGAGGDGAR